MIVLSYSGYSWPSIQLFFMTAGALFGYYIGGFDGFLRVLLAFVILDYITALALAVKERRLSSEIGFWGIFKKILIFAVVGIANLIDNEFMYTGDMLRNAVVFFYLVNEGISIMENCAALGLLIPDRMRIVLLKIRNNKQKDTYMLDVPADQIKDALTLKNLFDKHPLTDHTPPPGMTDAMYEELTNGRGADELH